MLLAGLYQVGADLPSAGRALSLVAGGSAVALTAGLARRALPESPWLGAGAALLVAANPCFAAWGSSGLETTAFAALVLAAVAPLTGAAPSARSFGWVSAAGLALGLTRPEGVAIYAVLAGVALACAPGPLAARVRVLAPGAALFALAGGVYFAWRVWYFGDWLPNTFWAKSGFSAHHAVRGLAYLWAFAQSPYVWALAPLAAAGAFELWRRREPAPLAALAAVVGLVVALGGDGLPMYRFLVPAVPLAALCAAAGAELLARLAREGAARHALGLAVLVPALALSFFPAHDAQYSLMTEQRDYELPRWRAAGLALGHAFPRDAWLAAVPIGALGWYSDLRVIDMVGLTDRTIAHEPGDTGTGWAGHEKHDGRYVVSRRPDAILLGNILVVEAPRVPVQIFPTFTNPYTAAREHDVVEQPEFARDYALAALPVGSGWTLHFFVRKDSPVAR
ncbi:MAG TPA: hypothetical protein VMR31_10720 [Myxococcota bacterium]|nr:hypothetical protein [Myxococcota bacterium]